MRSTFLNSGTSLSIGIFFSLMIAGLASTLPPHAHRGLHAHGVPLAAAGQVGHLPPVSTLFAALLGYNPIRNLLGPSKVLNTLPAHDTAVLTGRQFFPNLIAAPFHHGMVIVFTAAVDHVAHRGVRVPAARQAVLLPGQLPWRLGSRVRRRGFGVPRRGSGAGRRWICPGRRWICPGQRRVCPGRPGSRRRCPARLRWAPCLS